VRSTIEYSTGDVAAARADIAEAAVARGRAGDDAVLFDARNGARSR
jgi:hypothetical protein